MQDEDFHALEALAAKTKSIYAGKPSWRRFIKRIARGEIRLSVRRRRKAD